MREITGCPIELQSGIQPMARLKGLEDASTAKAAWLLENISARHILFESVDMAGAW
jgi:hypothetical protein